MTRRASFARAVAIGVPALWLAAFVALPIAIVAKISLSESAISRPPYRPQLPDSVRPSDWADFAASLGFGSYRTLLSDALYRDALISSVALALAATALIVPLGYTIALATSRSSSRWRPLLLALIVLPFWTSFLLRVYAWIAILKEDGWLNSVLLTLGLIRTPLVILDTPIAALIGLVYAYLPLMILPVLAALDRQDASLVEAAADLGAGPMRRFWTITFPLSWSGVAAGALLCFIPMVGEYVIPDLLGGADTLMLGRTLWIEFSANRDWPLACAVAVVLLAILVVPIALLRELETRRLEARR